MNEILKRIYFLVKFKKIVDKARVLHHNDVRFLAKFEEFTNISSSSEARIHTGFHRFTEICQNFHNNNNNKKDMYVFLIKANCRLSDWLKKPEKGTLVS